MTSLPVHNHTIMSTLLPHRLLQPNTPTMADWAAPRASLPRIQQRQPQPQIRSPNPSDGVLPFDFSAPRQPGLTFPKNSRAYYCPPEQIVLTKNYVPPLPNPLRNGSTNPIFFTDTALKEGVAELFAWTVHSRNNRRSGNKDTWRARQELPYDPNDDDLMVWKIQPYCDEDRVKANGQVSNTWPPWDFHFLDFEL